MRRWGLLLGAILWLACGPAVLAQGGQTAIHVVQRGENLYRIALQYGTSVEALAQANGITDPTALQVGQRLIVPSGAINAALPTAQQHPVQAGETLESIALRYGTTAAQLAALNAVINPARLYVGQQLDVGQAAPGRISAAHGYVHVVQPDETLYRIALRYQASLNAILTANDLASPTRLFPGQHLLIPGPEGAPPLLDLPAALTELEIVPLPAEVGRTIRIRAVAAQAVTLSGTFLDRPLVFFPREDGLTYDALYGVYAFSVPGIYPLTLTVQDAQGNSTSTVQMVRVADGGYGTEVINLIPGREELLDPAVNAPERALVAAVMGSHTPERYFDGPMGLPAAAPVNSPFGTRRSYNGGPYDTFHTGADFAGPPGAAIYAPAPGRVVLAETLQVRGVATILDHGWGVYTGYWHQQESYVEVGDFVSAGQVLGTIGSTGRVTGAHLHWEMWVNGVEVDPLQWTRESFP